MSSKKQELMSKIRWIIDKGAVHILGTNVVNKVLSFFTNIFIVRFLTKSEYGIFGYANNIISFFLLVSGLVFQFVGIVGCKNKFLFHFPFNLSNPS